MQAWQGDGAGSSAASNNTSTTAGASEYSLNSQAFWSQQQQQHHVHQGYNGDYYNAYGVQQDQAVGQPHAAHQPQFNDYGQQQYSQYNNYYYQYQQQYPQYPQYTNNHNNTQYPSQPSTNEITPRPPSPSHQQHQQSQQQHHQQQPQQQQQQPQQQQQQQLQQHQQQHSNTQEKQIEQHHTPSKQQSTSNVSHKPHSRPSSPKQSSSHSSPQHSSSHHHSTIPSHSHRDHPPRRGHSPSSVHITPQHHQHHQLPQSPLEARVQTFLSSTDTKHSQIITKLKKLGSKEASGGTRHRRSLSPSSEGVNESGFCKVPPFQEFAGPPVLSTGESHSKRERVYDELALLTNNALITGVIEGKRPFGLFIQIRKVADLDGVLERGVLATSTLEPLRIKALCHLSELSKEYTADVDELGDEFAVGKHVRGLLLTVDPSSERINLSFKTSRLPSRCDFVLGPISDKVARSRESSPARGDTTPYNSYLHEDPAFTNPNALESMTRQFRIDEADLTFLGTDSEIEKMMATKSYDRLRDVQNSQWAQETVEKGIGYAKQGDYNKAMQCYEQALEVDQHHRDAFVARGAAYANMNMLEKAVIEFETALKIDPDDKNARKYLTVTREKIKDKKEEREREKDRDRDNRDRTNDRASDRSGAGKDSKASLNSSMEGHKDDREGNKDKSSLDKIKNLLEAEERERKKKKKKRKDRDDKDRDKDRDRDRDRDREKDRGDKKDKKDKKHKKKHKHKHKKHKHSKGSDDDSYSDRDNDKSRSKDRTQILEYVKIRGSRDRNETPSAIVSEPNYKGPEVYAGLNGATGVTIDSPAFKVWTFTPKEAKVPYPKAYDQSWRRADTSDAGIRIKSELPGTNTFTFEYQLVTRDTNLFKPNADSYLLTLYSNGSYGPVVPSPNGKFSVTLSNTREIYLLVAINPDIFLTETQVSYNFNIRFISLEEVNPEFGQGGKSTYDLYIKG